MDQSIGVADAMGSIRSFGTGPCVAVSGTLLP